MNMMEIQTSNEYAYCKKHIDRWILKYVQTNPELQVRVRRGVAALNEYRSKEYHYDSKNHRIAQLQDLDLQELTEKVITQIAYYRQEVTFVTVVSQLVNYLGFSDRVDGATTMAEIITVLCASTDLFDLNKPSAQAQIMLISKVPLDQKLHDAMDRGLYILPMVVEPRDITKGTQSPYLTFNESQFTGRGGNHACNMALDTINIQNKTPLSLSREFLTSVEEVPNSEPETAEQLQEWQRFRAQSYSIYHLLITQGNRFHLTYKNDKRGRMYAQGYHVSTQGTAFKKASIELADKEIVNGVPDRFKTT